MVVVGACPFLSRASAASRGARGASCLPGLLVAGLLVTGSLLAGCRSAPVRAAGAPTPGVAVAADPAAPAALPPSPTPRPSQAPPPLAGTLADDTRLLVSPDFRARNLAAQRLVRAGAASLPALGAAGAQAVAQPGSPGESTTAPVIAAIVAQVSTPELVDLLQSPYPGVREQVAREAGRRGAWDAVPGLIEALGDAAPGVRADAHAALKRITGEVADPRLTRAARGDLRERWRAWWSQVGRARAADGATRG